MSERNIFEGDSKTQHSESTAAFLGFVKEICKH